MKAKAEEYKLKDLLSEIESYWTTRAEGYSEVNHKELNGMQKGAWLEVLKSQFPEKAKEELKILVLVPSGIFLCDPG